MILVDSNIFMYAAGAEHPNKAPCQALLRRIATTEVDAAIDAEVLQEILHRYRAIHRWTDGQSVFDLARRIVPRVLAVTDDHLVSARNLMDTYAHISARDALHVAVALDHGIQVVCSFDRDFDAIRAISRAEPGDV